MVPLGGYAAGDNGTGSGRVNQRDTWCGVCSVSNATCMASDGCLGITGDRPPHRLGLVVTSEAPVFRTLARFRPPARPISLIVSVCGPLKRRRLLHSSQLVGSRA